MNLILCCVCFDLNDEKIAAGKVLGDEEYPNGFCKKCRPHLVEYIKWVKTNMPDELRNGGGPIGDTHSDEPWDLEA